ncbi:MAG: glycoside hydrolase 43 family protein [Alistipes sp.]|nr:glycoside hydrolase 43 family protein [Alistipes sp.]
MKKLLFCLLAVLPSGLFAQSVWTSDLGNGKYKNPVLFADYSDPDLIRTGDDYWMTASSFNCVPGLQILHSTDLVNWEIVNAVMPRLYDGEAFDKPLHGEGVWAPAIRFHDGWYYIYWGDPYRGVYMSRTQDPRGEWSEPLLVKKADGIIDTCPLWDDDGRAYLVHGWAGSCAGLKSVLSVTEMSPDGTRLIGEEVMIFDGHGEHPTVEGPKFYKRNGWYYVFAPAGGVKPGWQIVLRSRSPWGPYECRTVLHQGDTETPGPHQGGWVEDVEGNSWFMHFVDMYAYGRVAHLQPMTWSDDDWCIIGVDRNGDGIGEPVDTYRKPACHNPMRGTATPADSDEFSGRTLGLQWQWHANPQPGWYFNNPSDGELRLYCRAHDEAWRNLADNGNLLLQKVNAPTYTATTKLRFHPSYEGDRAGLMIMGYDYATVGLRLAEGKILVEQNVAVKAIKKGAPEKSVASEEFAASADPVDVWLRCRIERQTNDDGTPRMVCRFFWSRDGKRFRPIGEPFTADAGHWIGAKIGYYADAEILKHAGGWIAIDWFRPSK